MSFPVSNLTPTTYSDAATIISYVYTTPDSITIRDSYHNGLQSYPPNTVFGNTYSNLANFYWFDQVSTNDDPPDGYIMSPISVFYLTTTNLVVRAYDDIGVANVTASINGGATQLLTRVSGNIQNGNHQLTSPAWVLGQNTIIVTITDTNSQMKTLSAVVTMIEPPPPVTVPKTKIPVPCLVMQSCQC